MAAEERPALPRVLDHVAERVGEAGAEHEDQQHLHEVRERRRALERVRRVGVEEAAAVGAELLDGFLRRDGPLRDGLRRAFDRLGDGVGMEVLDDALRAQDERRDDRDRKQDVERARASGRPRSCRCLSVSCRAKPRISAMATAMPAAAETKFCTASAAICTR